MKLHECTYGRMVITSDKKVGFVVGLTYNVNLALTGGMSSQELFDRTIPIIAFANGDKYGIHPGNIQPFE